MVAVNSTMLPLGTAAPDFALPDPHGRIHALDDFAGAPALVVVFMCNHCPYVKHIGDQLAEVTRELMERGVAVVGINSNDVSSHPDDSPEAMAREIERRGYGFPYLYDEDQTVARAYRAACTPDFYVFDKDRQLVYRGQMDGARPSNDVPVTGEDLRTALDAVLAGEATADEQVPSIGCNIKWKAGNEPEYFG